MLNTILSNPKLWFAAFIVLATLYVVIMGINEKSWTKAIVAFVLLLIEIALSCILQYKFNLLVYVASTNKNYQYPFIVASIERDNEYDNHTTYFEYDSQNNLTRTTESGYSDGSSIVQDYSYNDSEHSVETCRYVESGEGDGLDTSQYLYDDNGLIYQERIIIASNEIVLINFYYDSHNNIINIDRNGGIDEWSWTNNYSYNYDSNGDITQCTVTESNTNGDFTSEIYYSNGVPVSTSYGDTYVTQSSNTNVKSACNLAYIISLGY